MLKIIPKKINRHVKVFVANTAKGEVSVLPKYVGETGYEPPHGIVASF